MERRGRFRWTGRRFHALIFLVRQTCVRESFDLEAREGMTEGVISEWQSHLAIDASAAATLLGLVFVAASINLRSIVVTPALPGRVLEALLQFTQVLFVSMMMTIPNQTSTMLSVEILFVALFSWALQVTVFVRHNRFRRGDPRRWLIYRISQAHLATLPFIIGAVRLWIGRPDAIYWTIPGFFFSFFAGIVNSWVLLIGVGRRQHGTSGEGEDQASGNTERQ
jgi:hypothetical protein